MLSKWWDIQGIVRYEVLDKNCTIFTINASGGACGVMVIVIGNGHGDTSSNLGRD